MTRGSEGALQVIFRQSDEQSSLRVNGLLRGAFIGRAFARPSQ
jgi:hypothetical protein